MLDKRIAKKMKFLIMHKSTMTKIQLEETKHKLPYANMLLELMHLNKFDIGATDNILYDLAYTYITKIKGFYWIIEYRNSNL